MKSTFCFLLFLIINVSSIAQDAPSPLWKALIGASKFYDIADYQNAAEAYKEAFKLEKESSYANHRLFAAASNCMIDNEEGVREHLYAILPMSTETDMKKVLVNYRIFDKYYETEWWKTLKTKMDERLEQLISHHKNLNVFKHGRNLIYKAIRINSHGDTLANTIISLKPDGTGWGSPAASLQSQIIYEYHYTKQDSIDHLEELTKVVTSNFWIRRDTTGVIENDEKVWLHPIRNNEFFKTEIAPFPEVIFPISKQSMIDRPESKIYILNSWGDLLRLPHRKPIHL